MARIDKDNLIMFGRPKTRDRMKHQREHSWFVNRQITISGSENPANNGTFDTPDEEITWGPKSTDWLS